MTTTTIERVWMTRQAHTRLESELAALRSRPSRLEVPYDLMDYNGTLATYRARQRRVRQIRDLLTDANVRVDPPETASAKRAWCAPSAIADTGETETFPLGAGAPRS